MTSHPATAATLTPGYTIGTLTPAFLDNAGTGGSDSASTPDPGWVVELTGMPNGWKVGDQVKITGVALPIRPTTTAGIITFNFFDLDQGVNANAFEGISVETLVGSAEAGIADVTSASAFYVVFDTPVIFTARSTGIAVHFTNSTANLRLKINTAGVAPGAVRKSTADGTASGGTNPNMRFTLAGSVIVPPPAGQLNWYGDKSANWDTTTLNWNSGITNYSDDGTSGPVVMFDDTLNPVTRRTNINLTTGAPLRPKALLLDSATNYYSFSGPGKITGATVLTNTGKGRVLFSTANDFAGGSTLIGGRVRLGNVAGLGVGPITFAGGGLSSADSTALSVANVTVVAGVATLGDSGDNGLLTFPGTVDFAGGGRTINTWSDVVFSGVLTNGGIDSKGGPATLTLNGTDQENAGGWSIRDGVLKVDGISLTRPTGSIQVGAAAPGGTARLIITNGAVVTVATSTDLRLGVQGQSSLTSSNYFDLAGTLQYETNVSGQVILGQACNYAQFSMYPGSLLRASGITYFLAAGNSTVVNLDRATIVASANNLAFMTNHTAVNLRSGGVTFDTAGYNIGVFQDLLNGGGAGGLTKRGAGALTLGGPNLGSTYTGATVIQEGTLAVVPASSYPSTSPLVASNGVVIAPDLSGGSTAVAAPSVSLNGCALQLSYGTVFGNPGSAAVDNSIGTGTALTVNGANTILIAGSGFVPGQFPLIKYSSRSGSGSFQLQLPLGVFGTLVTNTATSPNSIDLNITTTIKSLTWWGGQGNSWNNSALNWNFGAEKYTDYGVVGDAVNFDDSGIDSATLNTNVNLTTAQRPASLNVNNSSYDYHLGGPGKLTGPTVLSKDGSGALTLATVNDYTGGSYLSNGVVRLANETALGSGPVYLRAMSDLALSSGDSTPRMLTNAVNFENTVPLVLGDLARPGTLTFAGPITLGAGARDLTCHNHVVLAGALGNGGVNTKLGSGTLVFQGGGQQTAGDWQIGEGDVLLDGATVDRTTGGVRLACQVPGGVSRIVITNGATLVLSGGGQNVRVGSGTAFVGDATATNILNLSGTLTWTTNNTAGTVQIGASSALAQLNLLPGGLLRVGQFAPQGAASEVNFNGGTLAPMASRAAFMQGLGAAYVRSGGAIIDTESNNIDIAQNLLDGGGNGGLTKNGLGTLSLNGINTYAGATVVNAGALGGAGVIAGSVQVAAAGVLAPGNGLGALTVNQNLTLAGTAFMEVDAATLAADQVTGVVNATYGGSLVVSNMSTAPLTVGQVFTLFTASGSKSGSFASISVLGAGSAGLTGSFDRTTGQLTLVTATMTQPQITQTAVVGGNLILQGTNGPASGSYSILTSTNVALPLTTWTTNVTGSFSAGGTFSNSIPVGSDPARFFLLKQP